MLLEAYEAATKRVVHLDYQRVNVLVTLSNRDVSPDDIWTVVRYVKRLMRTGENRNRIGKFVPASLEFMNLLGDTSKFCDRLQTAREELVAKRIQKGRLVAATHQLDNGDTITRLEPQRDERAPLPMREAVVSGLLELVKGLQK